MLITLQFAKMIITWSFVIITFQMHSARNLTSLVLISCNRSCHWSPRSLAEVTPSKDTLMLYKLTCVLKFVFLQLGCPRPHDFDWIHFVTAYKVTTVQFLKLYQYPELLPYFKVRGGGGGQGVKKFEFFCFCL